MGQQAPLRICLAQLELAVGDFKGNQRRIIAALDAAPDADVVLTPEFSACGYPPEDLVAYPEFIAAGERVLDAVAAHLRGRPGQHAVIGLPRAHEGRLYNVAAVVNGDGVVCEHRKNHLPNYGVFDEKRYFADGEGVGTFELRGHGVALAVCHDVWVEEFAELVAARKPAWLLALNASPFHLGVQAEREAITRRLSKLGCDVAYVNKVGGQDEHVFDGGSHVARAGEIAARLPLFAPEVAVFDPQAATVHEPPSATEQIAAALQLGVRGYVEAAGAAKAFVGVSGGIDSAVALALAARALGPEKVVAVLLPAAVTAAMSVEDGAKLAANLGVECLRIPIAGAVKAFEERLAEALGRAPAAAAAENLQARARGVMLMALANDAGGLVLTTGNKSEMATGFATLYGDMAGAFDVLKDIAKGQVYELAAWLNREQEVIPA
ncbi:MAG: NAD(+) synthase, partial [Betaproteobacteria bacterium AqS2]|nr:NAD(+) synthase [Betaproteobacteria bacterium AqS2]